MLNPLKPFINLLFPNLCFACAHHEPVHEEMFCHLCWNEMPRYSDLKGSKDILKSKFPLLVDDEVKFHGLFLYSKGGVVQSILRDIKYKGKAYKAVELGSWLGKSLKPSDYDALIPVPIHYKKKRKRGYNQAERFAEGISRSSGIQIIKDSLQKIHDTGSQTQLTRASRQTNVKKAYIKGKALDPQHRRILLVDDVITTGATLDVCTQLLHKNENVHVDYAFIAMAV